MTDHYALALEQLEAAIVYRDSLSLEYEAKPKDPIAIARLESRKRDAFTRAKLHTNLAAVQASWDQTAEITRLIQLLTREPGQVEDETDATVLELLHGGQVLPIEVEEEDLCAYPRCGRDNRNGTHDALEQSGHLSHPFTTALKVDLT